MRIEDYAPAFNAKKLRGIYGKPILFNSNHCVLLKSWNNKNGQTNWDEGSNILPEIGYTNYLHLSPKAYDDSLHFQIA